MEKKLLVFVSSVIDELEKERNIVKKAIKSIDIAIPWLFEVTPASSKPVKASYLEKVIECDVFVLILATRITKPVELEYQTAKTYDKPMLIFIKMDGERSPELEEFISRIPVKYRKFITPKELKEVVTESVADLILQMFRKLLSPSNKVTLEKKRQSWTTRILTDFANARFIPLKEAQIKDPLELIKEIPKRDKVLPLMSQMLKFDSIPEQIKFARQNNYAEVYSDSWAERELQLIGLFILKKLEKRIDKIGDMYDAGCANCGQYKVLITIGQINEAKISPNFKYHGQDFNSDWEQRFNVKDGKFFLKSLPLVPLEQKHTLVSCTHALHYLGRNLIAMYASLFSFNKLLKPNCYCYITVPEKATQPGMLDLLEKAAIDAGFRIVEAGKSRLVHTIMKEPYNITTFLYLIIQKIKEADHSEWEHLIGVSFFRAKHKELSEQYDVKSEGDIKESVRLLEKDLKEMLNEKNSYLRTFRHALDIANNEWKNEMPTMEECRKNIKRYIKEIHELTLGANMLDRKNKLELRCTQYFYWLTSFYVNLCNGLDLRDVVYYVYPMVKRAVKSSEDIRVNIDDLTDEQVARLLRHLFEFSQYEGIDIEEKIRGENFLKWVHRATY